MGKKILIIAAHPDDEVLGCGGVISKYAIKNEVCLLILGEGITSRYVEEKKQVINQIYQLKEETEKVSQVLGISKTFYHNFPDNKFDSVPMLNVVKKIEEIINFFKPDIIYTHHFNDLNIDHRIVSQAVLVATRPIVNQNVKTIYFFEVLSSTEWNYNNKSKFVPNIYEDISREIDKKIKAMTFYQSEIRHYPHPRSSEGIKILAKKRGLEVGLKYAESFVLARSIIKNV